MNFLDAAYQVLKQAGTPLHYTEITKRALTAGILDTKGQTPEATMGARLYVDTKQPTSRFRRVGNQFGLAQKAQSQISQRIEEINSQTRAALHQKLLAMPPDRFEALIGELLIALGFDENTIDVTSYSNDGGIDIRGILKAGNITSINAAVQVKRWKNNVQAPTVQTLRGALTVHEQGIIITTSKFTSGAIQEAQAPGKTRISLVDGEQLVTLLLTHSIGVKTDAYTVYTLDDEWWGVIGSTASPNNVSANQTVNGNLAASPPAPVSPSVPYPVSIYAYIKGIKVTAELLDDKGQVRYNGKIYKSPSGAGGEASGWKSCNGWTFWYYIHPSTNISTVIQDLRTSNKAAAP